MDSVVKSSCFIKTNGYFYSHTYEKNFISAINPTKCINNTMLPSFSIQRSPRPLQDTCLESSAFARGTKFNSAQRNIFSHTLRICLARYPDRLPLLKVCSSLMQKRSCDINLFVHIVCVYYDPLRQQVLLVLFYVRGRQVGQSVSE